MITRTIFGALHRWGVDRYTLATWEARLISRHYQAFLEAVVISLVVLLVLLFAATARAGQAAAEAPGPAAQQGRGQMDMGRMKDMAGMKAACGARHERAVQDAAALRKTVGEAMASTDVTVLRAALAATLRHLDDAAAAAKCEQMKPAAAPTPATPAAPAPGAPHVH